MKIQLRDAPFWTANAIRVEQWSPMIKTVRNFFYSSVSVSMLFSIWVTFFVSQRPPTASMARLESTFRKHCQIVSYSNSASREIQTLSIRPIFLQNSLCDKLRHWAYSLPQLSEPNISIRFFRKSFHRGDFVSESKYGTKTDACSQGAIPLVSL